MSLIKVTTDKEEINRYTHTPLHTYVRYAVSWKDIENAVVQKGSKYFSIRVVGLFSNSAAAVGGRVHAVRQGGPRRHQEVGPAPVYVRQQLEGTDCAHLRSPVLPSPPPPHSSARHIVSPQSKKLVIVVLGSIL